MRHSIDAGDPLGENASVDDNSFFPEIICNSRLCHKALGLLHNSLWKGHDEPPKRKSLSRSEFPHFLISKVRLTGLVDFSFICLASW